MSAIGPHSSHGEMKRRLAELVGADTERYSAEIGNERHKELLAKEVDLVAEAFGLGFLDGDRQEKMDAIMLKLDRDHRVGIDRWDSSDLLAVIQSIEDRWEGRVDD